MELAEKALRMEEAGHALDGETIHGGTDELLQDYANYIEILKPYFPEEKKIIRSRRPISFDELEKFFEEIRAAMEELDMDTAWEIFNKMAEFSYKAEEETFFEMLGEAASEYDVDKCEDIIAQWENLYKTK